MNRLQIDPFWALEFRNENIMAIWDVIVVGLGGVGSAAAFHLARHGHRVLGLDQFAPVHDRGSSHGKTRIIRQAYFEHPAYVPLLRRAYQLWDDLECASGRQLFCRTGLVEMGPADGIVVPGVLRSASEYELDIEQLTTEEISRRWPGLRGDHDWSAVIERNAGFLRVEDCVETHLTLAHRAGASCVHGVTVKGWQVDGDSITVTTTEGSERAAKLILASGPWSGSLLRDAGIPLRVLRKHLYWFHPASGGNGCTVEDGFPCFFHETADGFFYGFPAIDGDGVKVARHSGGEPVDQPTERHPSDHDDRGLVDRYVAQCLPAASDRLVRQAGCYYTVTPDEHFIIDHHPEYPQVTVIAGLSGHGFKFTSVLGEIAGQLATGEEIAFDIGLFRMDRG